MGTESVGAILPRVLARCGIEQPPPILIDTREQRPLEFGDWPTRVETMRYGDYGLDGFSDLDNPLMVFERKSINDLVGTLTAGRDRFVRECHQLSRYRFAAIVIEGHEAEVRMHQYRSQVPPQSILGTLTALQYRYGVHVIWAGDREHSAEYIKATCRMALRSLGNQLTQIRKHAKGP